MKKIKLILLLPLIFTSISCGKTPSIKENIINKILEGVNIKISGQERKIFPNEYSHLNQTKVISIDRDYKIIIEDDGSKTPAVRENTNNKYVTYLKGKNGQAVQEVYTADNKVTTIDYQVASMSVLFNEYFANPFEFIDESDISDDYCLSSNKANFLVSSFTGLNYAVNKAQFKVENSVATALDIYLYDRIDGMIVDDEVIDIYNELDLRITFDYDNKNIMHLTPRKEADETLKSAFKQKDNYTLTFSSNVMNQTCIAYITKEAIFIHNDINSIGLLDGDEYYVNNGKNYIKYVYSDVTNKFSLKDLNIERKQILPDLSKISPNILINESKNVYSFDYQASVFGLEKMILPKYKVNSGFGLQGTLILENNNFSSLTASFDDVGSFVITQNYYDYEKTSLPNWLDVTDL